MRLLAGQLVDAEDLEGFAWPCDIEGKCEAAAALVVKHADAVLARSELQGALGVADRVVSVNIGDEIVVDEELGSVARAKAKAERVRRAHDEHPFVVDCEPLEAITHVSSSRREQLKGAAHAEHATRRILQH